MQINNAVNPQIIKKQQNFKGSSASSGLFLKFTNPDLEKFGNIPDNDKIDGINSEILLNKKTNLASNKIVKENFENTKLNEKLNFWEKLKTHPSLTRIPAYLPFFYGIYRFAKIHSLKKKVKETTLSEQSLKDFKKASSKKLLIFCATAVPIYFVIDYINKKSEGKNFAKAQKQIDYFNAHNGTNVELVKASMADSTRMAGSFNAISGKIKLTDNITGDILNSKLRQTYVINHELIHVKQAILMARSVDGIKKLNYINVKKMTLNLDEITKLNLYKDYQSINKEDFKDDGAKIDIDGYKISIYDFITAIYKVLYENETNPDNIPIIINKEFYEKAITAKGQLTTEEEKKAQAYFEAEGKNKQFNPDFPVWSKKNSEYKNNLIEQEAFKAPRARYII